MIIFGGKISGPISNDVWVLTNANGLGGVPAWIPLAPTGTPPEAREMHSAVYDQTSNRMIIFGGGGFSFHNDVWVLTNANGLGATPAWIQLSPTGTRPPGRYLTPAAYDPNTNRMIIFGGILEGGSTGNDLWVLTNANGLQATAPTWTQINPLGTPPSPRAPSVVFYDSAVNRTVTFGGYQSGTSFSNDLWALTNGNGLGQSSWIQLMNNNTPGATPIRIETTGVSDTANNRLTVFGGCVADAAGCHPTNATWLLANANGTSGNPTWTQLFPAGNLPQLRHQHTAVYDPTGNRMIVFGGGDDPSYFLNDVWVLTNANGIIGSQPVITQLLPNRGGNAGSVTTQIIGTGLQSGATVKLTGSGPDITGTNTIVPNASVLTTTFNLMGVTPGTRTVVVTNPDNTTVTLTGGFTVEQGGAAQISVNIIGRNVIRIGTPQTFYLALNNTGNVDASPIVASIGLSAPTTGSVPATDPLLDQYQSATVGQIESFAIPTVAANCTQVIPFSVTAPPSATAFHIRAQHQSVMPLTNSVSANASLSGLSTLFTGLLNGPPLFDGCSQPLHGCVACDPLWNRYTGFLNLAQNSHDAYSAANQAFLFKGLETASEITRDAAATVGLAAASELFVDALGIAGVTEAAELQSAVNTLLQAMYDAAKGIYLNEPGAGVIAVVNAAVGASQTDIVYSTKIKNKLGIIKSQALQEAADRWLLALSVVEGAIQTLRTDWSALKTLWDQRNQQRSLYITANTNLCQSVNDYLACLSNQCGGGKTLPPDTGTDDIDLGGPTVTSTDPNTKYGATGSGTPQYVSAGLCTRIERCATA
jgi:hypothetical protein